MESKKQKAFDEWFSAASDEDKWNALTADDQHEIFGEFLADGSSLSLVDFDDNPLNMKDHEVGSVVKNEFKRYINNYDFPDDIDAYENDVWNLEGVMDEAEEADAKEGEND